jgi:hypothetical protein
MPKRKVSDLLRPKRNSDIDRIRTCAGEPKRFLISLLNHSDTMPLPRDTWCLQIAGRISTYLSSKGAGRHGRVIHIALANVHLWRILVVAAHLHTAKLVGALACDATKSAGLLWFARGVHSPEVCARLYLGFTPEPRITGTAAGQKAFMPV